MQVQPEDEEEEGANIDLDAQRKGKCVVLKTSTRQTIFLPVVGLVDANSLKPSDLVGVNKDSYLILDTLPAEYDSRVKAMEVRYTLPLISLHMQIEVWPFPSPKAKRLSCCLQQPKFLTKQQNIAWLLLRHSAGGLLYCCHQPLADRGRVKACLYHHAGR